MLEFQLSKLEQAVEQIQQHMATKAQVAQLASRSDVERLQWQIDALKEKVERTSVWTIFRNWTTIVAGLSATIALAVVLYKMGK